MLTNKQTGRLPYLSHVITRARDNNKSAQQQHLVGITYTCKSQFGMLV